MEGAGFKVTHGEGNDDFLLDMGNLSVIASTATTVLSLSLTESEVKDKQQNLN